MILRKSSTFSNLSYLAYILMMFVLAFHFHGVSLERETAFSLDNSSEAHRSGHLILTSGGSCLISFYGNQKFFHIISFREKLLNAPISQFIQESSYIAVEKVIYGHALLRAPPLFS